MYKKLVLAGLLLALGLTACGAAYTPAEEQRVEYGYADTASGAASEAPESLESSKVLDMANSTAGTSVERLVIKNATLSLVVTDPVETADELARLAEEWGGFVVTSNVYQASTDAAGNKIMRASVSLRVPAVQLNAALAQIKAQAVTVQSENVSGEDVTAQYTDLESRLRNLEAAEAQLQKIMDGATKTEDVLSVFNQLVYIREQIEQVKGQLKYYSEAAAMSLISVELIPDALSQPIEIGGWKPQGVAKDAVEALIDALQGLATAVIWGTLFCLPLGALIGVPGYYAGRWVWKKWRGRRAVKQ